MKKYYFLLVQLLNVTFHSHRWHVQSRLPVSPLEERLHESSWLPRRLGRVPRPPVASRSPIGTVPEPSLYVRSGVTRNPLSCLSVSCRSSVWCVKSHKISKPIFASNRLPLAPSRRPAKPISLDFSRTPTCAPFMPSASPSCPRTSSWPGV